jgi:hypothetical protein
MLNATAKAETPTRFTGTQRHGSDVWSNTEVSSGPATPKHEH